MVVESKITDEKVQNVDLSLPGFAEPERHDRTANGGGIIVWGRTNIGITRLNFETVGLEVLWFSVKLANFKSVVLCAAYRPPSDTCTDMMDYFLETVPKARKIGSHVMLLGDFNLHCEEWFPSTKTTTAGNHAAEVAAALGLEQCIECPTRGLNTLDLILTDISRNGTRVDLLAPLGKSDHDVILYRADLKLHREPRIKRRVYDYGRADWGRLKAHIREANFTPIYNDEGSTDSQLRLFESVIRTGVSTFIPSKMVSSSSRDPSWWNESCTKSIKCKQRRHKLMKQRQTPGAKFAYKLATKDVITTLSKARREERRRLRRKLTRGGLNAKQWWTTIKRACGKGRSGVIPVLVQEDGSECVSNVEKAEAFSEFFSSKCSLGDMDFTDSSTFAEVTRRTSDVISRIRFRKRQVRSILRKLDTSKAVGPDQISPHVLKNCAAQLATPASALFSNVFRSGNQPSVWKTANVTPVYKKGPSSRIKNYRPISLLSILSKTMEKLINSALVSFLESRQILCPNQFGFRRNLGTADVLTSMTHEWISLLNARGCVRILAIDIAGAFDKVAHAGLLLKAQRCGVSGQLLDWIRSYLDDRHIYVTVAGAASTKSSITSGVPQGSILGPTLFLIYVNDLADCLPNGVELVTYADDTTLFVGLRFKETVQEDCGILQEAVDAVERWGRDWRITFEPAKSQAMTVSRKVDEWDIPDINFCGRTVNETDLLELLGMLFDKRLTLTPHVIKIGSKASIRLGFFRRVAPLLDRKGRATVYKGFVRPVMEHAPLAWMGTARSALQRLDAIQDRAQELIGNVTLDSLTHRRKVAGLTYLFKLQCLTGADRLKRMVPPRALKPPILRHTRARQAASTTWHKYKFDDPLVNDSRSLDNVRRAFPYAIIADWNSIPQAAFPDQFELRFMQKFKADVHKHLKAPPPIQRDAIPDRPNW